MIHEREKGGKTNRQNTEIEMDKKDRQKNEADGKKKGNRQIHREQKERASECNSERERESINYLVKVT